jgi:hypothetical protein
MVLVPVVADTVVFSMIIELPLAFKPSIVTLSAPLRSISGLPAAIAPLTVTAPIGVIVSDVHELVVG